MCYNLSLSHARHSLLRLYRVYTCIDVYSGIIRVCIKIGTVSLLLNGEAPLSLPTLGTMQQPYMADAVVQMLLLLLMMMMMMVMIVPLLQQRPTFLQQCQLQQHLQEQMLLSGGASFRSGKLYREHNQRC